MKTRTIILALTTMAWLANTHAGDLNVVGNLNVASNLAANTMAVNTVSLGGIARTNWPAGGGATVSATDLSTAVLDFSQSGRFFRYTLTSDATWIFTNHTAGKQVWLQIAQDNTGSRINTWPTDLLWPGGTAATVTPTSNTFSVFQILDNGSNWLAQTAGLNYSVPGATGSYALQFDGSQNYVAVGADTWMYPQTAFTFEAWIKPLQDGYAYLGNISGTAGFFIFSDGSSVGGAVNYSGGSLQIYASHGSLVDSYWHHVALEWDGTTYSFWLDGTQIATVTDSDPMGIGSRDLAFGYQPDQGYNQLAVDEVRFSNIARYSGTFTPSCALGTDTNTVAYWRFDEGSGTTTVDASGNGHNATLYGSPVPTWVSGGACGGGGSMNMVSRGGGSMSIGRRTTGSLFGGGSLTNSSTVTLTNSPVNGSSITITDTLGRVWGLLSHP